MVLYFSATGNTAFVAGELAKRLGDEALNLREKLRAHDYGEIHSERPFVICTPIYVCEPPRFFTAFLRRVRLTGSREAYFVFTSGGYSGISSTLCRSVMRRKGIRYKGSADFKMPRNYIASDAYGELETDEIEDRIRKASAGIPAVVETIRAGGTLKSRHVWLFELVASLPFNPVWCHFRQGVKLFHVGENCISCGKCERICPLNVISLRDGKPVWNGKRCAHCMSCIQNCPVNAIEYGDITQKKKRYRFDKYRYVLR